MFSAKSKSVEQGGERSAAGNSMIGQGAIIRGDIICDGDLRIDGTLKGNIKSNARIVIGPAGMVEGDIEGLQADVLGKITGKVVVKDLLNLRGQCVVNGDIFAGKLQVEPTATFNGHCHMGANVVELNADKGQAVNQ